MKYNFKNDYTTGCHPNILKALTSSNLTSEEGYGEDQYSKKAVEIIKERLSNPDSVVHFVSGGTQANLTVIASVLRPYESIIAVETAHISVHETGAIEATGHQIQTVKSPDGKLTPQSIQGQLNLFEEVHTTIPRLVYISNSTEIGTIYTLEELKALSQFCRVNDLILFVDGARLASALTSSASDVTLHDLAIYTDVFYIGGTKVGALIGEAIVINNKSLQKNFIYNMKQRGALLAKGRLLGIQFLELFKDDLFFELGDHANKMALKITTGISDLGLPFLTTTFTNQLFPIFPNVVIAKLMKDYAFYTWIKIDDDVSAVRLVTSWSTEEHAVDGFLEDLKDALIL